MNCVLIPEGRVGFIRAVAVPRSFSLVLDANLDLPSCKLKPFAEIRLPEHAAAAVPFSRFLRVLIVTSDLDETKSFGLR